MRPAGRSESGRNLEGLDTESGGLHPVPGLHAGLRKACNWVHARSEPREQRCKRDRAAQASASGAGSSQQARAGGSVHSSARALDATLRCGSSASCEAVGQERPSPRASRGMRPKRNDRTSRPPPLGPTTVTLCGDLRYLHPGRAPVRQRTRYLGGSEPQPLRIRFISWTLRRAF